MIISCPNCSTRFLLEDDQMPEAGRKVRCARCAHVWHEAPGADTTPVQKAANPEIKASTPVVRTADEPAEPAPGTPELVRPVVAATAQSGKALVWVLATLIVLGSAIGGVAYLMPMEFRALTGMGEAQKASVVTTKESWGGPKAQSTPKTTFEPESATEPELAAEPEPVTQNVPQETNQLAESPESPTAPTIPTSQSINFSDDLIDMGLEEQPTTSVTPQGQP